MYGRNSYLCLVQKHNNISSQHYRKMGKKTLNRNEMAERNRMQYLFYDNSFCKNFYQLAFPGEIEDKIMSVFNLKHEEDIDKIDSETPICYVHKKNFEKNGLDVSFCIAIPLINPYKDYNTGKYIDKEETKMLKIKIVPNVSDDYPSLLGDMQKKNYEKNCLFLKEYTGELERQFFLNIFSHQNISVVFESELTDIFK